MINYSIQWSSSQAPPRPTDPAPTEPVPADPLIEGLTAHRRGDLETAWSQYAVALRARPNRALASYNLAVLLMDQGAGLAALPLFARALALRPTSRVFRQARLYGLLRAGRLEEARALLAEAEQLDLSGDWILPWKQWIAQLTRGNGTLAPPVAAPGPAEVANELPDQPPALATASLSQQQLQEPFARAIQAYQAGRIAALLSDLEPLLARHPAWGEGHHLLGLGHLAQGETTAAAAALRRAAELLPGRAEIWDHLGIACARNEDAAGVNRAFEAALMLNPLRAATWHNAADAAWHQGEPLSCFQLAWQAVRLEPSLRQSCFYLLQSAHQLDLARTAGAPDVFGTTGAIAILKATVADPAQARMLAPLFAQIGRYDAAVEILEQSLARFGDQPLELLGELVMHQRYLCDWRDWAPRHAELIRRIRAGQPRAVTPFAAIAIPGLEPGDLLQVARARAVDFLPWSARAGELRGTTPSAAGQRLRVGYLSSDFQDHATAYLTAALFEHHDRTQFEVFAYSCGEDDGGTMRRRLHQAFEHFIDLRTMSPLAAAQRIRDDGIQILVDLKGYTRDARTEILALRPAPVQIGWLGFPGGSGAPFMDYLIADRIVAPPEQAGAFDEHLLYLPDAYAPVDPVREVAERPTRGAEGLPEQAFVFCCFNDPYKITPTVFDHWCRILQKVPDAALWLYARLPATQENLRREAAARDIHADRLIFAERKPQAAHLARLPLADLFLDTLPVNAHTTASDALWMGLPLLTCLGTSFASRVAASLLAAAGLPELITRNLDDYRTTAIRLASDADELARLRQRLLQAREQAPYFAIERFTRNLEALLRQAWAQGPGTGGR